MAKNNVRKKAKDLTKNQTLTEENEIVKFIKLVIIVSLIFLGFYLLTIFINKEEEKEIVKTTPEIQYDKILVGEILNQSGSYYVLCYDTEDYNHIVYKSYADVYESSPLGSKIYSVEINNPFNSKFVSEESNFKFDDISELRIKGTTLLKIENKKIVKYFENDDVLTELSRLVKEIREQVKK